MKRYDVAVIGLGIVGASVVYTLTRAGARVIALDAGDAGTGTSASSFAWVNAVRKEPEAYHRLNAAGMAAHRALARELGGDAGYHQTGSLEWAEDGEGQHELRARVARLAGRGYPAEFISVERVRHLEPELIVPEHAGEVAFYPGDGWLDASRLIGRLLAAARGQGAEIRESRPVRSLRFHNDRVDAVIADDGETVADSILVCVGPATQAFLTPLGITIPVGRVPGLLAVTSPTPAPLGRVVHAPGVHLRPDVSGGLLLGAADVDTRVSDNSTPAALASTAHVLLERVARVFRPARDVRLLSSRAGIRPMPADGLTIAGRIPGLANAWVLATHSGITLGPLLGHLITEEIVGATPSAALAPFRPERFAAAGAGAAR
jgi:glycine/D-amino acid oxidase-like deaminating enzyme